MMCPACLTDNPDTAAVCQFCGNSLGSQQSSASVGSPLQLLPGTALKQNIYQIKSTLGQGGFGITYSAVNCRNNQTVAIKELLPEKCARQGNTIAWPSQITPQKKREQIAEVQREALFLGKCNHPNIVKIYDSFEENETAYIVMQMVVGTSLTELRKQQGKLSEKMVQHYFIQVGEALREIHSRNLLHRDINPNNIMVDSNDQVTLIDFGNVREFIAGQSLDMTRTITPGYAPLEQYSQRGKRGPATDFYAVCATMYELLTGQLPPEATERLQVDTLKSPRLLEPSLSLLTEKIILNGLKIRAEDRFQNADELIQALKGKFISSSLRKARLLVEQSQLSDAAQAYDHCLASEPNNAEVAIEFSLVLVHLNDSRTEATVQRAIQLNAKEGRSYGVLGLVLCRRANWPEAVKQLQQAANLAPTEAWIHANLAWALGMLRQWQQAEKAVEQALQCDEQQVFALGLKAWIAVQQQKWKPAISAARKSLTQSRQSDPQDTARLQQWIYPCLAIALYEGLTNKQAPDLDRCLQEFMTYAPEQSFAWGFKAWHQANQGCWTDALQNFEQAIQKRNVPMWMHYNFGITQEHQCPSQTTVEYYERLSHQFSEDAFILFRLGTLLGRHNQCEVARSHLERAIQLQPDSAEAQHNFGWVLLNLRKQDPSAKIVREIFSAYRKAVLLYSQQNQHRFSNVIQQEFQSCGIDL
jgi:eukaryotic-like serine/threonine-protein kinase